jgi:ankyrin repeat protein
LSLSLQGNTPLHLAAVNGHAEVVRLLREAPGADGTVRNKEGKTPLEMARAETVRAVLASA